MQFFILMNQTENKVMFLIRFFILIVAFSFTPAASQEATGFLTIAVTPPDARVRIMNIDPKYQDGIQLNTSKSYDILITHSGFESHRETININEGHNSIEIVLNRSKLRYGNINQPTPLCETRKRALSTTVLLSQNPDFTKDVDALNDQLLSLEPFCFYVDRMFNVTIYKTNVESYNGIEMNYAEVTVHKENGDHYFPDEKHWWVVGPNLDKDGVIEFDDGSYW